MQEAKYILGIDEAGRGPLAGPVAVGVVCVSADFNWDSIPGVNDSKKLTEKKREEIFAHAMRLKGEGRLAFAVSFLGASAIDTIGIVPSVKKAMERALSVLQKEIQLDPASCMVKLDGSLKAPREFLYQETIIKGDAKEKVIGLASILAKVTRDRYMCKLAQKEEYVPYDFAIHKGYGTKAHRRVILTQGLSDMHRQSFCRRLMEESKGV